MTNIFSKDDKKFSLISPVYGITYKDFPKYFEALNKSEYKNFEVIIVFDGKHLKGERLLKKMIKEYPDIEVRYKTIKHGGACAARNAGTDIATGDYWAFPSPDCYLYPETLRTWANAFDEDPSVMRVWGLYDILRADGSVLQAIGQMPFKGGEPWYPAFKFSPYADATFPVRKEYFIPWDETQHSLNDWEWSVRYLKKDGFSGKGWKYMPQSFFIAEDAKQGGLSSDSHQHWEERKSEIMKKNSIEEKDLCVTSLGAQEHAIRTSDILDAEFLTMPSFKPHHYKAVYLLGFYLREDPSNPGLVTRSHMKVFERNKGANIVHWIGTDIYDLRWHCSFEKIKALKKWFKKNNVIHLCEAEFTQKELKEVGIDAKIVPLPPNELFEPMPLPEEFSVGIYLPESSTYMPDLMDKVIEAMPDVKFYLFGNKERKGDRGDNWEHIGFVDFKEWMPKVSANLRITAHDGLPLTPLQFLTAGRNVVTNTPIKGAIKVDQSLDSIVKGIRKAQKEPLNPKVAQYWIKKLDKDKFIKTIRGLI